MSAILLIRIKSEIIITFVLKGNFMKFCAFTCGFLVLDYMIICDKKVI